MNRIVLYIVIALVLIGLGFGIATWRHRSQIAQYDERERARQAEIDKNKAEQNQIRGENDAIRKENEAIRQDIAALSASEEALKQLIKEHGGTIAVEGQKLDKINEQLKNDQAVLGAPADKCLRCRRYSASLVASRLIDRPLTCADECKGANR